uniref:hypothetical protein n=1 Tax=Enterobacter hormaechei TaxID=158836 RepID=UPI001954EBA0
PIQLREPISFAQGSPLLAMNGPPSPASGQVTTEEATWNRSLSVAALQVREVREAARRGAKFHQ